MVYRYKIGQNVMVSGPSGGYGQVFHQEVIDGVEHYSVHIYGDKPSNPDSLTVDRMREQIIVSNISPQTIISKAGGTYESFDEGARARHRDGSEVVISATSTVVDGNRVYTGLKEGTGWGDFPELHLI